MEDGYTNYTLRMRERDRDEWKEAVEESEQFTSLSQLVRYSVEQEIRRIKDRQEGELTKEEQEVMDKVESEHALTRDLISKLEELTEQVKETTITESDLEAMNHQQTQTILANFKEDKNE